MLMQTLIAYAEIEGRCVLIQCWDGSTVDCNSSCVPPQGRGGNDNWNDIPVNTTTTPAPPPKVGPGPVSTRITAERTLLLNRLKSEIARVKQPAVLPREYRTVSVIHIKELFVEMGEPLKVLELKEPTGYTKRTGAIPGASFENLRRVTVILSAANQPGVSAEDLKFLAGQADLALQGEELKVTVPDASEVPVVNEKTVIEFEKLLYEVENSTARLNEITYNKNNVETKIQKLEVEIRRNPGAAGKYQVELNKLKMEFQAIAKEEKNAKGHLDMKKDLAKTFLIRMHQ